MHHYVQVGQLQVHNKLYAFLESEALPGSKMESKQFWQSFEALIHDFSPENKALLERRDELQHTIDEWHRSQPFHADQYKAFLEEIGYLEPVVDDFEVTTAQVDSEIAELAGPQLVVPINNARYALNAANARWGSLYDALYGTDAIGEEDGAEIQDTYNPIRGKKVVAFAKSFLDQAVPLSSGVYTDAVQFTVNDGQLNITLEDGQTVVLRHPEQFAGYTGNPQRPDSVLLSNHGLHIDVQFDHEHPIGKEDPASIKDIVMEAALTTIMDCEDSVTAVDAEDKVAVYRNWLGLIKGNLASTFTKDGRTITRTLQPDRAYISPAGESFLLSGRSLMLIRNVGHLMTTDAILDQDGQQVPEGILDTVITSLIAKHDLLHNGTYRNSKEGSVYIVKPKMHGSAEVAFSNALFDRTEQMLGLSSNTLKIGVMDEERRTSLNLKNCIKQVRERVVFINTGFLDRTGDEIHTSMEAGAMIRKNEMKTAVWLQSYEKSNVLTGLSSGFQGKAQIGKGMWAMPDLMKDMLDQKAGQLEAGANTAWVPSPTAAVLHAIHYHQHNVTNIQRELLDEALQAHELRDLILQVPVAAENNWTEQEIQQELDNNAQSILGYVVRWVEQGIGCSKVPDINDVALMEDRATLRISSQHLANWLHHGICSEEQVMETMQRMAKVVDEQNKSDAAYRAMAPNYEQSIAFQAACELVFEGAQQPNGYTEPILHRRRVEFKQAVAAN